MKKISIVGVEGSGKTVLMSVLGDVYSVPNKDGLFLNPQNKETFEYCAKTVADMRKGYWPQVTEPGQVVDLQWSLCRAKEGRPTENLGDVTMMDFAGEVYREAFGKSELSESFRSDVESLQKYVAQCDKLLILINLKDIIDGDRSDQRTIDMLWTSKSIIDYASEHGICDIAIAFTQSERYSGIIDECGGVQGALRKYQSLIFALYPNLNVFAVSAVKETVLNDRAIEIPTQDFHSVGLDGLIKWMAKGKRRSLVPKYIVCFVGWISILGLMLISILNLGCYLNISYISQIPLMCNWVERVFFLTNSLGCILFGGLVIVYCLSRKILKRFLRKNKDTERACVDHRLISKFSSSSAKAVARQVKKVRLWKDGPYWADRNIGAEKLSDTGYYFWWGDTVGYKRENNKWIPSNGSLTDFSFKDDNLPNYDANWVDKDDVLIPSYDAAHIHWGGLWRLPTKDDMNNLINECDWEWTIKDGVNGYLVKGRGDFSYSSIFLPCAGLAMDASLKYLKRYSYYWTSTVGENSLAHACCLYFNSRGRNTDANFRSFGQPIRPVLT